MNWKEFKETVESQGVTDDSEIDYLDVYPDHGVSVGWAEYPSPEFRKPETVVTRAFYVLE